jgi:hypothetical protein
VQELLFQLIHCREQAHKGIATQGKRTGGLHGVQATSQLANVMKPFSDGIPRILVALGFVKSGNAAHLRFG